MGREGFEPSTLGLRVRADRALSATRRCKKLQRARLASRPNCSETQVMETSLYADPYAHSLPVRTTERPLRAGPTSRLAGPPSPAAGSVRSVRLLEASASRSGLRRAMATDGAA